MTLFVCPRCGHQVRALAVEATCLHHVRPIRMVPQKKEETGA